MVQRVLEKKILKLLVKEMKKKIWERTNLELRKIIDLSLIMLICTSKILDLQTKLRALSYQRITCRMMKM